MMSNTDYESLYHTCRWCKWYQDGKCVNEAFAGTQMDAEGVYQVAEDGRLSGVIEETLHSVDTSKLEHDLREVLQSFKLSDKRLKAFFEAFGECLTEFYDMSLKEKLDEAVSRLYQGDAETRGTEFKGGGVEIADPTTFYCKEFW